MKPLDIDGIADALARHKHVVVIEEHAPQGRPCAANEADRLGYRATCRLDTFTLQDAFIHNYGSHDDLLSAHGLDLALISARVGLA